MKKNIISKVDYSQDRLEQAIKKAVTANHSSIGQAEDFAGRVIAKIEDWIENKTEFTSRELRLQAAAALSDYDPDAAYFYENEKMIF